MEERKESQQVQAYANGKWLNVTIPGLVFADKEEIKVLNSDEGEVFVRAVPQVMPKESSVLEKV